MTFLKKFISFFAGVFIFSTAFSQEKPKIHMLLDKGLVIIETYPDKAPKTVKRIVELSKRGFTTVLLFTELLLVLWHKEVIQKEMEPGGSGQNIVAEFNDVKHERGIVSMARSNEINSADSQFFICYDSHPFLDGQYTVWGKVIQGMNLIDRIPEGKGQNGQVLSNPTKIITMRVK